MDDAIALEFFLPSGERAVLLLLRRIIYIIRTVFRTKKGSFRKGEKTKQMWISILTCTFFSGNNGKKFTDSSFEEESDKFITTQYFLANKVFMTKTTQKPILNNKGHP